MKNSKQVTVLLTFVTLIVAVTSTTWTDYRLTVQERGYASDNDKPTCFVPGPICNGCDDVYICDENLKPSKAWTCNKNKNETCDLGQCTLTPNFECSGPGRHPFPCQTEGLLPDPGSCFKYHLCVAKSDSDNSDIKSHEPRTCKNRYSYNVRTGYCDKKMSNTTCPPSVVPLCTKPLQTGPLKDNPSIYYTCRQYLEIGLTTTEGTTATTVDYLLGNENVYAEKEAILYPYLKICDNGKQYDGSTYTCK